MPSKSAGQAYRYHILSGHREIFAVVESRICEAFSKGYSVLEITRIIGSRKADYVHAVIVKNGMIRKGKPGPQKKDLVPVALASYLRRRALTYSKWCAGWDFDMEVAAKEINCVTDGPVMDAIRRDFPGFYTKLKKLETPPEYVHPPQFDLERLEANVTWDFAEYCYRAEKMIDASVRGYGQTMEIALKNLKISYRYRFMFDRLVKGCGVTDFC